jgi:hypothetical protein
MPAMPSWRHSRAASLIMPAFSDAAHYHAYDFPPPLSAMFRLIARFFFSPRAFSFALRYAATPFRRRCR